MKKIYNLLLTFKKIADENQVRNYFFKEEGLINPILQVFTSVHWCSQDSSYVRWRESTFSSLNLRL